MKPLRRARAPALALLLASCGPIGPADGPPASDDPSTSTPLIASFSAAPPDVAAPLTATFSWTLGERAGAVRTCDLDADGDGRVDHRAEPCPTKGSVTHGYGDAGTYTARLRVADGDVEEEATLEVVVAVTLALGTQRVSISSDGTPANDRSGQPDISDDGRFVAFTSAASNLVDGDTNDALDVFLHDRARGVTERLSVADDARQGDGDSFAPAISGDGRVVAFVSLATTLVPAAAGRQHVYVRDVGAGVTELVSVATDGSVADGDSDHPAISADGRTVAFTSSASNLAPEHPDGGLFVHDRDSGATTWIADGTRPSLSGDGRLVAFGGTGPVAAVFVHDRDRGATEEVSVASDGTPADRDSDWPSLAADGLSVAFGSLAGNLVTDAHDGWDVYVHDRPGGATELVSRGGGGSAGDDFSLFPAMSARGRHVAFSSLASNLVEGDTHVGWSLFVRDRDGGDTRRVPVSSGPQDLASFEHALSDDGRHVAFTSVATVVLDGVEAGVEGIDGEPNGFEEVFVHTVPADGGAAEPAAPGPAAPAPAHAPAAP
jgi:Tol biopolymer transport system component